MAKYCLTTIIRDYIMYVYRIRFPSLGTPKIASIRGGRCGFGTCETNFGTYWGACCVSMYMTTVRVPSTSIGSIRQTYKIQNLILLSKLLWCQILPYIFHNILDWCAMHSDPTTTRPHHATGLYQVDNISFVLFIDTVNKYYIYYYFCFNTFNS